MIYVAVYTAAVCVGILTVDSFMNCIKKGYNIFASKILVQNVSTYVQRRQSMLSLCVQWLPFDTHTDSVKKIWIICYV